MEPDPRQDTHRERKTRWRPSKEKVRLIGTLVALAIVGLFAYFLILIALDTQFASQIRWIAGVFATIVILPVLILLGSRYRWTGFGEEVRPKTETQDVRPAKTLWDWLQLLIIPAVLAVGGILFTQAQDERQQRSEEQRAQDGALQAYFDEMGDLLTDKNLRDSQGNDEVRALARARTLTILERLVPPDPDIRRGHVERPENPMELELALTSPDRRKSVLLFLYESGLINEENPIVSLKGANLRAANLRGVFLSGADLSGADLLAAAFEPEPFEGYEGADLRGVNLSDANLSRANLSGADLSGADLSGANLGSILNNVNLRDANLTGTDLRRTPDLTQEQIEQAYGDDRTRLPDYLQRPESWAKSNDAQPNGG